MAVCKYLPCSAQFIQANSDHVFHSAKCKAAWHREQLYKSSVAVTVVQTRTSKRGINTVVKIDQADSDKLAKIAVPGARLLLVAVPEEESEQR